MVYCYSTTTAIANTIIATQETDLNSNCVAASNANATAAKTSNSSSLPTLNSQNSIH